MGTSLVSHIFDRANPFLFHVNNDDDDDGDDDDDDDDDDDEEVELGKEEG